MSRPHARRSRRNRSRGGDGCSSGDSCCDVLDLFNLSLLSVLAVVFATSRVAPQAAVGAPRGLRGVLWRRVRAYQLVLSPTRPASCRMTPTCSAYAATALTVHGPVRGTLLALGRLRRCRPAGPTGPDPVPTRS